MSFGGPSGDRLYLITRCGIAENSSCYALAEVDLSAALPANATILRPSYEDNTRIAVLGDTGIPFHLRYLLVILLGRFAVFVRVGSDDFSFGTDSLTENKFTSFFAPSFKHVRDIAFIGAFCSRIAVTFAW